MLKSQYGVAASSSAAPTTVSHAEDAQPNETIYKRRHGLPPPIGSTCNYRGSGSQQGSFHGGRGTTRPPWTKYAIRGSSSSRGSGNVHSSRGDHNSSQRYSSHVQRSTHHVAVPPITTSPDIEYHISSDPSLSPSSSHVETKCQPTKSNSPVIRESRPHNETHLRFSEPTRLERQLVDDHHWLHRSRSPSPKLPPLSLKRRKVEHQSTHVSNSAGTGGFAVSQSINHRSQLTSPSRPLLPGRRRRPEDSAPVSAPLSVQARTEAIAPITPNILAETSLIKQEPRTPSPARSLRMERSLITSSCKFYPIPELCKKSYPDFKDHRKAFFREKMQELSRLGLKKIKSFFRDDGLVIEWQSQRPVWSDTLLPEFPDLASAIKRAHQLNHLTSAKSSPKRKRQRVDRPTSRESSLKNNIEYWAAEVEVIEPPAVPYRISTSPTPTFSSNRRNRPSADILPLTTSELIPLDPETVPYNPGHVVLEDAQPLDQQKMSAMEVDASTPTQPPKPMQRMLFKPVHPLRRNRPSPISVQDPTTLLSSDSVEPLSTTLTAATAAEGHLKKVEPRVQSQSPADVQERVSLPRPLPSPRHRPSSKGPAQSHTLPLECTQQTLTEAASQSHTPIPLTLPPPLHLWDVQIAEEVEVKETRISPTKDEDHGNATDPDAELVVNLLLCKTPEDLNNRLSTPRQKEIMKDLRHQVGHENHEEDKDDELSVSAEEDMAGVEGLATEFLQRYIQLFDVDRLKLGAAYVKDALFSCRVHHVQEPSFSMAGLFAPEGSGSRQGFNVSRYRAAIQRGRVQIVNRLLELGPHSFCPRGVPRMVHYDVAPLPVSTGGDILLTVHGEVVNPHLAGPQMDHILSLDQSFVLRKRRLKDEDGGMDGFGQMVSGTAAASNLWPLVAVSHQMTVRDAAPLPLEQLNGLASRIQGS